jgi:hypothetical protein
LSAPLGTRCAIVPDHETPAREILSIEEPLITFVQRHIPHLIQAALELFFSSGEAVFVNEVSHDVQILLRTQSSQIVGRLGGADLAEQIGDGVPSLRPRRYRRGFAQPLFADEQPATVGAAGKHTHT